MNFKDINFPLYRKYKNNKSYFKIIQPKVFEEIQIIGQKKIIKLIEAKQFPELMFIQDLVFNYADMAYEIKEEEYSTVKNA